MKFEYENNELDILDEDLPEDDNLILNYCKTLEGHTIMIDRRFKLEETEIQNVYLIKRKQNDDK